MKKSKTIHRVNTYDAPAFLQKHMRPAPGGMLKTDFGSFFVVRVQDMIKLMKLPVPPSKSVAHTCIFLTAGKAELSIGNTRYLLRKDEMLFVPAGSVFSFDRYDLNKGFLLHFKTEFLLGKNKTGGFKSLDFLQPWGNPYIRLGKETAAAIGFICKRIYADYHLHGIGKTDLVHPYLMTLLAEVNRVYQPVAQSGQPSAIHLTNRFRAMLFSDVKTFHRVTDYAQKLHVSPNHLNKCVKAVTGKSPTSWINEAIVLEAKALLYQTDLPVNEVASAVGHDDASYFTRLFKKHEGITPMAFRKMIEKS